jgi:sensor histidine kinase YesM
MSCSLHFMDKISTKTYLLFSLIIAFLLSLSPILILLEHHRFLDVLDKLVLFITAFFITFSNLIFQNRIQSKSFSLLKIILYTSLFNLILITINLLIRIPFWGMIPFNKPPLFVFVAIDLVRQIILALVAYWVIFFLNKNAMQVAYKIKLSELENQTLHLQLKNLTAQLQPHFFFNSLNVLAELIHIDVYKSDHYIQHLSNIFRYVLSSQETSFTALTEEISFIKSYLFLLKIRFDNSIDIDYDITNEKNLIIPSLCSLVVLENIVKHNHINNLKINISTSSINQSLIIRNSKNKKNKFVVESLGLGLANIDKKCQLLLQRGIKINETEDVFEVEIPLKKVN